MMFHYCVDIINKDITLNQIMWIILDKEEVQLNSLENKEIWIKVYYWSFIIKINCIILYYKALGRSKFFFRNQNFISIEMTQFCQEDTFFLWFVMSSQTLDLLI